MDWKMNTNRFLLMFLVVLLLASCGSPAPTPSAADIQTAIAETLTAAPTMTSTPTAEPEDTLEPSPTVELASPTPTPGRPLDATISVDMLNMRTGPSTFFDVVEAFEDGTSLLAKSRTPDNSWVQVEIETDDQPVTGWMFAAFLEFEGSISQLSTANFPADQIVTGLVQDENRDPIEGVVIAVVLSDDASGRYVNATTDERGRFTIYLPEDMFGILDVQVVSPVCESFLVDENCQVSSHILLNNREFISIPQENQEIIFVYETAAFTLTGTVTDGSNRPVPDISVTAIRDDGAVSYGYSDAGGEFSLPISEGIWEIYAVEFNPLNEGDHVTVTIADTIPDPVSLKAPD
jgi:hypothetical protein